MRVTDLTLGLLTLLAGIAVYFSALNFQAIPGQAYGAGTMPRAIALVTCLVGVFLIVKAVLAGQRMPGLLLADWTGDRMAVGRMLAVLCLVVVYIVVSPLVGFLPTAFGVLVVALLILGVRWPTALIVSAVTAVAIQQSFGKLLLVPLPRSDFFSFLW